MKTNLLSVALSFASIVAIAQKKEIKDAGKAVEKGNYSEAKSFLDQAKPMLSEAKDSYKADFYLFKGQAYLGTGENIALEDLMTASEAFKQAQEMGSAEAADGLAAVTNSLVQSAINDQNEQKFEEASKKLYAGYQINTKDTLYLYFAASNAINAKNYDTALDYYSQLKDLKYTGIETQYFAVNKETGEEEMMNKNQRDLMIKSGSYIKPEDRTTESRAGEIAKNIALIYIQEGKNDKAIEAMNDAKAANPGDLTLLQSEANIYYQMGDKAKYKEIMEDIVSKDAKNPTLYYNLGVTAYEMGDTQAAIDYYKKALELDPKMSEARLNIAAAILGKESSIVEEMNGLGMSKADTKKYDELAAERKQIYNDALPYLAQVIENDPKNKEAIRTSMNIYYQLGENDKAEAMKARIAELEK